MGSPRSAATRKWAGHWFPKYHDWLRVQLSAASLPLKYAVELVEQLRAAGGARRAGIAIAHKILVSAYRMLTGDLPHRELGETYLDRLTERRVTYNLTRRLRALGYEVTLTKAA